MSPSDIHRIIDQRLKQLGLIVERVTDLDMNGEQAAVGKDLLDHDVDLDIVGIYGLVSRAPDGADGWMLKPGGKGNSAVLIGYRHRASEAKVDKKGELALVDDQGQRVSLLRDKVEIASGGATITIDRATGEIEITPKAGAKVKLLGGGARIARKGDSVKVTVPAGTFLVAAQAGVMNAAPVDVTGEVTDGSPDGECG